MNIYDQLKIDKDAPEVESPPALFFSKGGKLIHNEWVYDRKNRSWIIRSP